MFTGLTVYSQGNLQFNQVLNLVPGSSYTVPTGKVVKIESITFSGNSVCIPLTSTSIAVCGAGNAVVGNYNSIDYLALGNMVYSTGNATNVCNYTPCLNKTVTVPSISVPFWLPAGKTISIFNNSFQICISAIEFNIIP